MDDAVGIASNGARTMIACAKGKGLQRRKRLTLEYYLELCGRLSRAIYRLQRKGKHVLMDQVVVRYCTVMEPRLQEADLLRGWRT